MKITETLNLNLENKSSKKDLLRFSFGAQFSNFGGAVLFTVIIAVIIIMIILFVNEVFFGSLLCLIISILLTSYVLDVQGIEINSEQNLIRNYKSFMFSRYGEWISLSEINTLKIEFDNLRISRESESSDGSTFDSYNYYTAILTDSLNDKKIIVAEFDRYIFALKFCDQFARSSGVRFKNPHTGVKINC